MEDEDCGYCTALCPLTECLAAEVSTHQMDGTGGEGAEKMSYKYQWTMSPWTRGCIMVGGIVSRGLLATCFIPKPSSHYLLSI